MSTQIRMSNSKPPAKRAFAQQAVAKKAATRMAAARKTAARRAAAQKVAAQAAAPAKITPVPEEFPTISAHLTVPDVKTAITFYTKVFGFELKGEPMKAGKAIIHAVLGAGNSAFMLGGPSPDGSHASPREQGVKKQAFGLFVYVPDVDAHWKLVKRQKDLVATDPQTMFWGDRTYDVVDRDGHRWTFASRVAILTPEQMAENLKTQNG